MSHPIIKTACVVAGFAVAALAASSAQASDPAPQQDSTGSSMKVGIDAKTGKRRALTAEESAALDAQATANASKGASAKTLVATSGAKSRFPATQAQAEAGKLKKGGIIALKPTADMFSSVSVTRNADGTLVYSEGDAALPMGKQEEAASE